MDHCDAILVDKIQRGAAHKQHAVAGTRPSLGEAPACSHGGVCRIRGATQLAFTNVEKALELARIYAERIAGIPVMTSFDPDTTAFDLVFAPDATINAPTMIRIPWHIDAKALDIEVTGGTAELSPSQRHVRVFPSKGAKLVTVSIR